MIRFGRAGWWVGAFSGGEATYQTGGLGLTPQPYPNTLTEPLAHVPTHLWSPAHSQPAPSRNNTRNKHGMLLPGLLPDIYLPDITKGWVRVNALRLSRASIYIEDTTTSTRWGSKCLWSQLLSFLLNLWVPPLVAIGNCETQGLRETMTLLRGLLGGCQGQALGGSRTKTSHSRQSVMLGYQNGCAHVATAKRANNQGENIHIYLILLHRLC